jgi:hypothetical protein
MQQTLSVAKRGRVLTALGRDWWPATLVGVVAFVLTGLLLGLAAPTPEGDPRIAVLSQKLEHLRRHGDDFDLLLVGSSRFHYSIDPALLDAEAARQGCRISSYNMGVQGLNPPELRHLLAELAAIRRPRWQWVLLERLPEPGGSFFERGTNRASWAMRDLDDLRIGLTSILTAPNRFLIRAYDATHMLGLFVYNRLGIGQLGGLIGRPSDAELPTDGYLVDLSRRGYVPMEEEIDPVLHARVAAIDHANLARHLSEARAQDGTFAPLSELRAGHFAELLAQAREVAPRVGLVLMPKSRARWIPDALAIEDAILAGRLSADAVVNFDDPRRHPRFYRPEAWYDEDHVTLPHVRSLTRSLAGELCRQMLASPG